MEYESNAEIFVGKSSFYHVHKQMYLALHEEEQTKSLAEHSWKHKSVVVNMSMNCRYTQNCGLTESFSPASLVEIYRFDEMANQVSRRNIDNKLIFAAGLSVHVQARVAFLVGCHLIMSHGLDAEQTHSIFKNFEEFFIFEDKDNNINNLACWRALYTAKNATWVDFQERFDLQCDDDIPTICMPEFIHYAR